MRLPESVSGIQFAPVELALVPGNADVALCPAQYGDGSQWKNNIFSVQFRFHAGSLRVGRQSEIERGAHNDGIRHTHQIGDLRAEYFRLEQERSSVRPVAHDHLDVAAPREKPSKSILVKGQGPGNTGNSGISKNTSLARVQRFGVDGRPPFAVGRAGRAILAGNITYVLNLECLHACADILLARGFRGVPDSHVGHGNGRMIRLDGGYAEVFVDGHEMNNRQFVTDELSQIERNIILVNKTQGDRFILTYAAKKGNGEKSHEVGFCTAGRQTVCLADFDIHDRRALCGVIVLLDNGAPQHQRAALVIAKVRNSQEYSYETPCACNYGPKNRLPPLQHRFT